MATQVIVAVVVGAIALGIALELLQAVDPFATRQADALDGVADAIGVGLGLLAWGWLRRSVAPRGPAV